MFDCFLLLLNRAQHIARSRDMRQIDLGLEFLFDMTRRARRGFRRRRSPLAVGPEILAHKLGLVLFQRTGVRFVLGHADRREHVKNRLALDFQLTGQIIDSNLHPFSFFLFRSARIECRCLRSHV
jgi:hypothetical protein